MARGKHARRERVPPVALLAAIVLGALGTWAGSPGAMPGRSLRPLSAGPGAVSPSASTSSSTAAHPKATHTKLHPPPTAQPEAIQTGAIAPPKTGWAVQIPAIDVDAKVIDLGLNADGTLEVPADFSVAGWYSLGPKPGQVGPSVIVGHVDSRNGPAVFYRLSDLVPGDLVVVWLGKTKVSFTVTSVHQYPKTAFPTSDVYGATRRPVLRLITCGGAFDHATGHYDDNIVVYASLAS